MSPGLVQSSDSLPDEQLTDLLKSRELEPSREITRKIQKQCVENLTPVRPLPRGRRVALSVLLCVGVTLGFAFLSGYRVTGAAAAALYGVMAWGLVQAGLLVAGFGKPGSLPLLVKAGLVVAVPVSFFLFLHSPFAELVSGHNHSSAIIKCSGFALTAGIVTAFGIMFLWRRTDPFDPGFSGSVAGLVGGLAGALAVGLVCRDHGAWHLWIGHGLTVVALVVIGRSIGRRWLAP